MVQQAPPEVGTVLDGYMFMGGDPAQESSWRPVSSAQTYANGRPRGLTTKEQAELAEAREAARNALALLPDLERFSRVNAEENTGGLMAVPGVGQVRGAFDPGISQLNEISARLTPQQRQPGSGTTSDRDLALFMQAVPGVSRPREANEAIIERAQMEGRRRAAYADFLDRYAAERGTLSGADELFRAQVASGAINLETYGEPERAPLPAPSVNDGRTVLPADNALAVAPGEYAADYVARFDRDGDNRASVEEMQAAGWQWSPDAGKWFPPGADMGGGSPPPAGPQGPQGPQGGPGRDDFAGQRSAQGEGLLRKIDAGVRGAADALTFGMADEIAAGLNAVIPLDAGSRSIWTDPAGDAFRHNLAMQRGADDADARDVPISRGAGQLAGGVAGIGGLTRAGTQLAARVGAGGRGALPATVRSTSAGAGYGAAYGFGSGEGNALQRADDAAAGAGVGAVGGAVARPLANALAAGGRAVARPAVNALGSRAPAALREAVAPTPANALSPRQQQVQVLRDHGVSLTPGQRMGGLVNSVEDLAQRAPLLGPAIRGARARGEESLNRAVGNRALDAIGEGVPANVNPGGEMVAHVQDRLGAEFDRAYSLVPEFTPDEPLMQGLARIGQSKSDLPPAMQQQFDSIIGERLQRLQGAATGQNVGAVRSELNTLAAGYLRAQDPAQQALGRMIAEVADELDGAVARASPEAGNILARARDGYADYIRMERASTAAGGKPFSPGQLATAVRASDGSVRRGAVGRGTARMQDLSRAASEVMPGKFGNPGTADAIGLGGLGVGAVTEPVTTATVAGGLGVASLPYLAMGRKALERLPEAARRVVSEMPEAEADALFRAASDPAGQAQMVEMLASRVANRREARNLARAIRYQLTIAPQSGRQG